MPRERDTRKGLIDSARRGELTFFLGAGVSIGRGIPGWPSLVGSIWREVHAHTRDREARIPPWEREGVAIDHPLTLQMALEDIEVALRPSRRVARDAIAEGRAALAELLHKHLYGDLREDKTGTLAMLVRQLRKDQKRARRRVRRVITLNADDLLEEEANKGHHPERDPVVWPIARASFHPRRGACAHGRPPISVYHIHGYLPSRPGPREAQDTLVFTDQQYWESVEPKLFRQSGGA